MKKTPFLFFILFVMQTQAQQGRTYAVSLRAQIYDSTGYCTCPQDGGTDNNTPDCNSLGQVMITVYADTTFLKSFYTDETGYAPAINLPYGKYKLIYNLRNYKTATVQLDFTAPDTRYSIMGSKGTHVHYRNQVTDYYICVMMEGNKKKSGVKIVPKN